MDKTRYIHRMFTDLCESYDRASTTVALGRDRFWRDFAASLVDGSKGRVLDACCGTGELSIRLAEKTGSRVVAVDFCEGMLKEAKRKFGYGKYISFGIADVEKLPFRDETFTCATIAFALRNVNDISSTVAEIARVVEKGGKVIILDLGKPQSLFFKRIYYCYFNHILPKIGGLLAGKAEYAYRYVPHSLKTFPAQEGVKRVLEETKLKNVKVYNLDRGIVAVHVGTKAG
ncbi:MAG: ubiquinone/menaquinone biosynthesis methyltransferase [Candidatus Hydrothermarchaeales archaeon]